MKRFIYPTRVIIFIPFAVIMTIVIAACDNKSDVIPKSDLQNLPSKTAINFETILSDSGKIQLVMKSSLIEEYDNNNKPYSEFRHGIRVDFHDGNLEPVASVTSKYAKYTQNNNIWELRDSVLVINENHEKLETELLFWDQDKDLIFTDRFVKITSEEQVMQGFGFESDSRLNHRKIKKVSATIYFNDEE